MSITKEKLIRRISFIKGIVSELELEIKKQGLDLESDEHDYAGSINTHLANLEEIADLESDNVDKFWSTDEEYKLKS